ncbi:hypothetical protein Val02_72800 [Virgisporangium aliadipatigenens]|uniref:Uncharacterized protein n=1 Tax=Virgisporangium aliadipatigenens TaxID=741659 RepID=A0A8J4DU33_9ACTN|nr:hypothetical protein Val02_72800 [Virgisporangium aliadipatigenens]
MLAAGEAPAGAARPDSCATDEQAVSSRRQLAAPVNQVLRMGFSSALLLCWSTCVMLRHRGQFVNSGNEMVTVGAGAPDVNRPRPLKGIAPRY